MQMTISNNTSNKIINFYTLDNLIYQASVPISDAFNAFIEMLSIPGLKFSPLLQQKRSGMKSQVGSFLTSTQEPNNATSMVAGQLRWTNNDTASRWWRLKSNWNRYTGPVFDSTLDSTRDNSFPDSINICPVSANSAPLVSVKARTVQTVTRQFPLVLSTVLGQLRSLLNKMGS